MEGTFRKLILILGLTCFEHCLARAHADEVAELLKYQILDAVEDTHPDGSKTRLYKIVPPPPKPPPPAPPPQRQLTEAERAAYLAEAQAKSGGNFALGGTVFGGATLLSPSQTTLPPTSPTTTATLLNWQHEGRSYTAWSRIDFNHLRSVGRLIDAEGRHHSFFLMIGTHPPGYIRLLHAHYAANTATLIQASTERQQREAAARTAPKPPKKDSVIIYTDIQTMKNGGQER